MNNPKLCSGCEHCDGEGGHDINLYLDDCDNYRDYPREVDFGPSDTLDAASSWDDISPF